MPFRLIFMAIVLVVLVVFIGFNVENRCDVSFAFYTLKDVPVILTILASFALGLLAAFPFALRGRKNRQSSAPVTDKRPRRKGLGVSQTAPDESFPSGKSETP